MSSRFSLALPAPLRHFFALFPLYEYPPVPAPYAARPVDAPTLWIRAPRAPADDDLSADVECLKWQAYLALRGCHDIALRWDVSADGALEGQLPNLQLPAAATPGESTLLPAHLLPGWADARVGALDLLEGYADDAARDESRAWVALMEGNVHAALVRPPVFLVCLRRARADERP